MAARVGAPSYVRFLLQFRAHPAGSEGSYGSIVPVDEVDEDQSRVRSHPPLAPVTVALRNGPPERPTSEHGQCRRKKFPFVDPGPFLKQMTPHLF